MIDLYEKKFGYRIFDFPSKQAANDAVVRFANPTIKGLSLHLSVYLMPEFPIISLFD